MFILAQRSHWAAEAVFILCSEFLRSDTVSLRAKNFQISDRKYLGSNKASTTTTGSTDGIFTVQGAHITIGKTPV